MQFMPVDDVMRRACEHNEKIGRMRWFRRHVHEPAAKNEGV